MLTMQNRNKALLTFGIEQKTDLSLRSKSRGESKPELVDSWLRVKMKSEPKSTHRHIRAEPELASIWPKSHRGVEKARAREKCAKLELIPFLEMSRS